MKTDVEGHEAAVLRGALRELPRTLNSADPTPSLFEEHGSPATEQESVRILETVGYRVFALPRTILTVRLRDVRLVARSRDLIAIRRGEAERETGQALRVRDPA